ncbi:TPA: LamG domain-containing protein [Candidatus Poribacteria bacterium]|nr:LamG domain-containing protein [Candidatus Poribacteria bacterium]
MKNKWRIAFGMCLLSFVFICLDSDAEIKDKDIIAQYTFDDGTKASDAIDISGNEHNGKFLKGASRKPGKFDMGAHFDADKATQAIWIDDHPDLNVTKKLSIVAWVKWNKGGIKHVAPIWWPMIVMKASVNQAYLLFLDTGDGVNPNKPSIAFRMKGPGTVYSQETVKEEIWYHAAGTYDGKAIKIYINGKLSNEKPGGGAIAVTNDVLVIGAAKRGDLRFHGIIDEVGIYNRALTPDEVKGTMEGFAQSVDSKGKVAVVWGMLKSQVQNKLVY